MQAILLGMQPGKEARDVIWNLQKDNNTNSTSISKKNQILDTHRPQPPLLPRPSGSAIVGGKITFDSYSLAKPQLLSEINEIINNGLKRIEKDNDKINDDNNNRPSKGTVNFTKLEVYRDAFQRFIEDSTIYRPFLNAVKHEYDLVIGELLDNLKAIPDLKMEMSKIEDSAAYKARGLTLAFEIKVQELMDKNKMIQKEQERKEKELSTYAQEMITLREENITLKAELVETKKSCITLTHSLNRYDEEMKKVQAREAARQADTAQLRVAVQKSTDEIEKLRALLSEMEAVQNNMVSHEVVKQQVETINTLETETKIMNATHKQLISRYSSIKSVIDAAYKKFANNRAEAVYLAKVAHAQTNAQLQNQHNHHHHHHHHHRKQSSKVIQIETIQREVVEEPGDDPNETIDIILRQGGNPRMIIESLIDNIEELKREVRQLQIDSGQIMLGVNEDDPTKAKVETKDDGFKDEDIFTCSWTHFIGEGFDENVPSYLKWSGLVQNLFMTRRDAQNIMKDIWKLHSSYGNDNDKKEEAMSRGISKDQKPSFIIFFENYIEKKFNNHSRGIELAYNFVNALKKFSTSCDCKCFLMILNGDIPVDVWYDQLELIKSIKESMKREEMARSHDGGKLNVESFMRVLKKIVPTKSAHLLARLQSAVEIENKGNRDINLDEILEEDANGIKGPFLDLLCHQHVSEFIAIADNISTEISNVCDPGAFDMPVSRFREAILGSDPNKPRSDVNEYLARGCGVPVEDMLLLEAKRVPISVADFKNRLFSGMIRRSPPN